MGSERLRFKDENGKNYIDKYEVQIGDVSKIYQPKTISSNELTTDGFTVYGANGIIGNYHSYNHSSDQVLISCRGENCGTVNFSIGKCWITGNTMVINVDESNELHKKFLYYQLINQNLKYLVTGSGQPQIVRNVLEKHKIMIFQFQEQEKIGNFLSLFDRLIEKLETKVGLLKELKKGYLQQMFPAKGEKVPKIRFKDENGNEYPDWKLTKLSKIGYFKTSSVDKKITPTEQEVFLVNYMDVYNHISLSNTTKKNLMRVTAKASQIKENNLLRGDILFTPSSETPDDIGHSVVVYEDLINTVYSYHLVRFRAEILMNLDYAHYFCNTQDLLKQMSILSQGATRFTLSLKSFNSLKIKISQSIEEQEKIGNFLRKLDAMIEKNEKESNAIEQLKKGYMQRLFA